MAQARGRKLGNKQEGKVNISGWREVILVNEFGPFVAMNMLASPTFWDWLEHLEWSRLGHWLLPSTAHRLLVKADYRWDRAHVILWQARETTRITPVYKHAIKRAKPLLEKTAVWGQLGELIYRARDMTAPFFGYFKPEQAHSGAHKPGTGHYGDPALQH